MVGGKGEGGRFAGEDAAADRLDGAHHAASAAEGGVGEPYHETVRVGGGRGLAQAHRDQLLGSLRVYGAQRGVGGGGGAADAGPAVHHDRPAPVPIERKLDQLVDVLGTGLDVAGN